MVLVHATATDRPRLRPIPICRRPIVLVSIPVVVSLFVALVLQVLLHMSKGCMLVLWESKMGFKGF